MYPQSEVPHYSFHNFTSCDSSLEVRYGLCLCTSTSHNLHMDLCTTLHFQYFPLVSKLRVCILVYSRGRTVARRGKNERKKTPTMVYW